jgi:hypothetical protein
MPRRARPTQLGRYVLLALVGFAGAGLIILADTWLPDGFWKSGSEHVGSAIIIAALLGLTIDWWLKKQITEDVFEAAMGYELPEDLREEIRYVYGNRVLCVDHSLTVEIIDLNDGQHVAVQVGIERGFQNISQTQQEIPLQLAVDEWLDGPPSAILEFAYAKNKDDLTFFDVSKRHKNEQGGLIVDGPTISLGPTDTLRVVQKYVETKHRNGDHHVTFKAPSQRPRVTAHAPEGLSVAIGFNHRTPASFGQYTRTATLNGLLLPNQPIRIRWWETEKEKGWSP